MKLPIRIRFQLPDDKAQAENFRDIQRAFDAIPIVLLRKIEVEYGEPLVLGNLDNEPDAIELIRVIDLDAPETPVLTGGMCHYVWRPDRGGAQITSIDGMTGRKKYRFTFRLTYAAIGGFSI